MRSTAALVVFVAALAASGCESYGPEELDRLTKEDPQFKQMIAQREQMRGQIRAIKADLMSKKHGLDAKVLALRREYDAYARLEKEKIDKFQAAIDVNRNALKREIDAASASLAAKETELRKGQATLAEMRKVLQESKVINLSKPEKEKWEERILMQSEKLKPLADEIQELRATIRLARRKLSFLR